MRSVSTDPLSLIPRPRPEPTWRLTREIEQSVSEPYLDDAQRRVVEHRSGALLVLAGPGTGKTTTLTEAVVARLTGADALKPSDVLVLTFARKSAGDIRERIIRRCGSTEVPAVSTFHSLALAIVREYDGSGLGSVRLLSGPEQELRVREILSGIVNEVLVREKVQWPETLREALTTRGLTVEIRNALARAQSLGLSGDDLLSAAQRHNQPEWVAVAHVLEEYLDNITQQRSLDYNELIHAAVRLTHERRELTDISQRYKAIYVDEYQDTDPMQIQLLKNLAAPGTLMVAVGDPDQSIYGFRGADSWAIRGFATDFEYLAPQMAVLNTTRRFGVQIRDAAYRVIDRNPLGDLPREIKDQHRNLRMDVQDSGEVRFRNFESAAAEAEEVAEQIRYLIASTRDTNAPLTFKDCAILVRSGAVSMPTLERALRAADIPVTVAFDDIPLSQEQSVSTLLLALEACLHPDRLRNVDTAFTLMTSPLGGIARADLRLLALAIKQTAGAEAKGVFSEQLLANALVDRSLTAGLDPEKLGDVLRKFSALQDLLGDATDAVRQAKPVSDVLWLLWSSTPWPSTLRRQALSGNTRAGRDLDCVTTLFDLARAHRSAHVQTFVSEVRGLAIAADRIESGYTPNAVSLMSAHRSKGLEWPVVFICGADEGIWPDIRRRTGIFQPEKIQLDRTSGRVEIGLLPERSEVVAEERRLFFVACTRAKHKLYVSSTTADEESGRTPSRFVSQLMNDPHIGQRKEWASADQSPKYSPTGLVAQLRRVASDTSAATDLKRAAVARLAYLASLKDDRGRPLVPSAHPSTWWGTAELTQSDVPVEDPSRPIYMRGSSLQELEDCSLSWFMSQRAQAAETKSIALSFGTIVHAFAQAINDGVLDPNDRDAIDSLLDETFSKLHLETPWSNAIEKKNALTCIDSFIAWRKALPMRVAAAEADFHGTWQVQSSRGISHTVTLRGQIDMLLVDADGAVYVADIKTGAVATKEKTKANKQLGLYQAAVQRGLLSDALETEMGQPVLGGAMLLFVRKPKSSGLPDVREQSGLVPNPETGRTWIEEFMADSAEIVATEKFLPTLSDSCNYCSIKTSCPLQSEGRPVIA